MLKKQTYSRVILFSAVLLLAGVGFVSAQDDDTGGDQPQALVKVTGTEASPVNSRILGTNILGSHLYGDDGGGIWAPEGAACAGDILGCYNPAPFSRLESSRVGMLRFPGGRTTRSYVWEGGVGPASSRDFLFGTDEFLFLAQAVSAEPVITVSLYDPDTGDFATDDVYAAAAQWLNYTNNVSPYGPVTYWEVDTDTWENTVSPYNPDIEYKRVPPEAYADAFLQMSMALKDVDASIRVGAVSYDNRNLQDTYRMLKRIVTSGADPIYWPDFVTINFYRPNNNKDTCNLYGMDLDAELNRVMAATFAASQELSGKIAEVLRVVQTVFGTDKPDVQIMLGEYNTQLLYAETYTNYPGPDEAPACPFRDLSHSLGAAIFNADLMMTLMPFADDLLGAANWVFMDYDPNERDIYGSMYLYEGRAVSRPTELVMRMFGADFHITEMLPTNVLATTFDNEKVGATAAFTSINIAADENYIRVRPIRFREPVENTPACGPDNVYNPEPESSIQGAFAVDEFRLTQDDLPPEMADNLLVNGDFEQDLSTGWQTNPDPAGVTTSRICESGNCYMQVMFENTPDNNPQYLSQLMQTVPVQPGKRYSLYFGYRAQGVQVKTQNLLCDPSWEYTSAPGAYNNAYWVQYASTPSPATILDENCFDGDNCVLVPIVDNPEYYHIRQRYWLVNSVFPELADPESYRVVGYIKTTNLDAAVTIEAQARNASDVLIQSADSYGLYGTTTWSLQDYRFTLGSRENTAFINVHLRRKEGRKDTGLAYFDDVRMYREDVNYAPRIAIDICKDAACADKRTVYTSGITGTRNWTEGKVSGTPLISAVAGFGDQNDVNILLINKDQENAITTLIDLETLGLQGDYNIYVSRLGGDSPGADNELGEDGPEVSVTLSGGDFYEEFDGSDFLITLPPYSVTGVKLIDPTLIGDDEMPPDDDTTDDDTHDDDTMDDDTADDDVDDDQSGDDDDDDDESCCGC